METAEYYKGSYEMAGSCYCLLLTCWILKYQHLIRTDGFSKENMDKNIFKAFLVMYLPPLNSQLVSNPSNWWSSFSRMATYFRANSRTFYFL